MNSKDNNKSSRINKNNGKRKRHKTNTSDSLYSNENGNTKTNV